MIEWGQKSKPGANPVKTQKILGPKLHPLKNPMPNFRGIKISMELRIRGRMRRGNYHEYLQTVLNTPKKHYLNQATKKILAKSFLQKIPKSRSHPPKSFDLPCHLKSGVPATPTPTGSSCFICQVSQ